MSRKVDLEMIALSFERTRKIAECYNEFVNACPLYKSEVTKEKLEEMILDEDKANKLIEWIEKLADLQDSVSMEYFIKSETKKFK